MKIAQIAPLYEAVPPRLTGGVGRMVAHLSDALVELGHEVTLFSSADARTKAQLVPVRDVALPEAAQGGASDIAAHLLLLEEVRRHRGRFDLMHFHTDMAHFPFFEDKAGRTVTTLHGRLDLADVPSVYHRWPKFPLVSISDAQRMSLPFANWVGTVHPSLPEDQFAPSFEPGSYLAFLGRMTPRRGPEKAIALACAAGLPIVLAAKMEPADEAWFREVVAPLLAQPGVTFLGEVDDTEKGRMLSGAAALVCTADGSDPFALTMIEAMACGTPVVALDRGCAGELVDEGVSGSLFGELQDGPEAVRRALSLDRRGVRRRFEDRFTAFAMARRYLDIYADRLAKAPFAPELAPAELALAGLANDDGPAEDGRLRSA